MLDMKVIRNLEKRVELLESDLKRIRSGVFAETLKEALRRNEEMFIQKAEEAASKAVDDAAKRIVDFFLEKDEG